MAALAYVLLPVTGAAAYFGGRSARVRFHGLQAIAFGLLWPAALYAASAITPGATQAAFAAGALGWLWLVVATAAGRDPRLPVMGAWLERAARLRPGDR